MTKLLLLSTAIFIWSCNSINNDRSKIADNDNLSKDTVLMEVDSIFERTSSEVIVPHHDLQFADIIIYSNQAITIDTVVEKINIDENLVGYRLNPSTNEILRLYGNNERTNKSVIGCFLNGEKIELASQPGKVDEFNGEYLFFNIWKGGDIEGTITKAKYKIEAQNLIFVDSLRGGFYSEGAGTWEWLIGNHGEAIGILNPDDRYFLTSERLLVKSINRTNQQIFLIDYIEKDTLLSMDIPDRGTYDMIFDGNRIFLHTHALGRLTYLKTYDINGTLLWEQKTGFLEKIVSDTLNNVVLAHGYYHTGTPHKNSSISFVICFDAQTGERRWDFPTSDIYDGDWFRTSNLFSIGANLYGVILGQTTGYQLFANNLLVIFNGQGEIVKSFKLSSVSQKYSVINSKGGEFKIISEYENRTFKITADNKK